MIERITNKNERENPITLHCSHLHGLSNKNEEDISNPKKKKKKDRDKNKKEEDVQCKPDVIGEDSMGRSLTARRTLLWRQR